VGIHTGSRGRLGILAAAALGVALLVGACSPGGATPTATGGTPAPGTAAATDTAAATGSPGATATPTVAVPTATPTPAATPTCGIPTITTHHISTHSAGNSWSVEFDEPVVGCVSAATTMNTAIDAQVQAWITDFTSHAFAQPSSGGIQPAITYLSTLTGKFTVALVSSNLLSLRFAMAYYAGGAHDINKVGGLSFKVPTGTAIAFADLFTSPAAALPVLNTQTQALLTAMLGGDLTWSPAPALNKVSDAWVLTTTGLELSWARGTVGPESAGPVAITIPWASLAAVVNPAGPAGVLLP
jgi:hypothetical protein